MALFPKRKGWYHHSFSAPTLLQNHQVDSTKIIFHSTAILNGVCLKNSIEQLQVKLVGKTFNYASKGKATNAENPPPPLYFVT